MAIIRISAIVGSIVFALAGLLAPIVRQQSTVGDSAADVVWGQPTLSSSGCVPASATSLCHPVRSVTDASGNLWVSDWFNSRVLMFPFNRTTGHADAKATVVLGQYGDLTAHGCNRPPPNAQFPPAPSAYSLCKPNGLAIDRHGTLYVSDQFNNRILVYYAAAHTTAKTLAADAVLGQPTFQAIDPNDYPATGHGRFGCGVAAPASACTLFSPEGLALDASGDLLVADTLNNRVLMWSAGTLPSTGPRSCSGSCGSAASRVWGQYGSFTTNCPNEPVAHTTACSPNGTPTPSARNLNTPEEAVSDAHGNLYVADTGNNRVLEYRLGTVVRSSTATAVFGQECSFKTSAPNDAGVSARSLNTPTGLAVDDAQSLWVSDFGNNRVVQFGRNSSSCPPIPQVSTVLGQGTIISTSTSSQISAGATTLDGPTDISFDREGNAFVSDHGNNSRVLEYFRRTMVLGGHVPTARDASPRSSSR